MLWYGTPYFAADHLTIITDPESFNWHPLSNEFLTLLDSRPYISPSRENRLTGITPASMNGDDRTYIEGNKEPVKIAADSDSISLFHVRMPGILSEEDINHGLEELGRWGLLCGDRSYKLEVREVIAVLNS